MSRVLVWNTLPSFRIWPKKTFFGLDKGQSHCFTLPKEVTLSFIRHFNLQDDNLQSHITFIIRDKQYTAEVRWVRIDRSKPYKLGADELPKRDVIQFQWAKEGLTQAAMRVHLPEAFDLARSGENNDNFHATFHHLGDTSFLITN